jgi:hypothetical protein
LERWSMMTLLVKRMALYSVPRMVLARLALTIDKRP